MNNPPYAIYKPYPICHSPYSPLGFSSLENLKDNSNLIVRDFLEWLDKDPFWVLVRKKDFKGAVGYKGDAWKVFRVFNRFDRAYVKKVLKKWEIFELEAEDLSFVHIVLTVRGSDYPYFAFKNLKRCWNRLNSLFKKRLGKFDYVTVVEPQKNGNPHLHILIFTDKFVISHKELSDWCRRYGLGYVVWLKRYWAKGWRKQPIYYLRKYLTKLYKKKAWSENELRFFAYLWFFRVRTYSFSGGWFWKEKEYKNKKKEKRETCWEFVAVGFWGDIKAKIDALVRLGWWAWEVPLTNFL